MPRTRCTDGHRCLGARQRLSRSVTITLESRMRIGVAVAGMALIFLHGCGGASTCSTGATVQNPECNQAALSGPCVTLNRGSGSAPPSTGGRPIAGTYVLTDATEWGPNLEGAPPWPTPLQGTMILAGSEPEITYQNAAWGFLATLDKPPIRLESGTLTLTAGSVTAASRTCPSPANAIIDWANYTASANEITLVVPTDPQPYVWALTFSRQ